jgi:hypothetical protein
VRRLLFRVILALYPRPWRARYGQELQMLADELERNGDRSRARVMSSLVAGAAEERAAALRASAFRTTATVALVTAVLAAVAVVTVSAFGSTSGNGSGQMQASSAPQQSVRNGSRVSFGNPSPRIEQQLQSDIRTLCTQVAAGKRATAIELNPTTGLVVAKIVQTCGGSA